MEVIPPYPTSLHGTPSTPVYTYPAWATSTSYANGDIVRWEGSGTWRDYRSRRAHLSSATRTPVSTVYWTDLGPSSTTTGMTYTTNVAISLSDAWTSGAAVAARQQVYDLGDHHDYVATAALTSAQNTLRPSQAIRSSDPAVAARWVDLGAANAWAVLDGLANSYLIGLNASGNSVNPTFTVNVTNAWYGIDRICVTGMAGVSKIEAKVYVADALVETVTQATAGVAPFWRRPRTAILPVTQAGSATAAKIELTFTRAGGSRVNIGLIVVGKSYAIANTHWGAESSILSFSRTQRNETFGTIDFIKRGSARRLRATCQITPSSVSGDTIQELLREWDGKPVFWDFNNGGTAFDRLRVFGYASSFNIAIPGISYETLAIDVEGLVE